jgi:DNA-directed RNA polymerase I, II, and III subunit RPABC2
MDDIIESGDYDGDFDEDFVEDIDGVAEQAAAEDEHQGIFKKLYQQHPECLLDYVEQVYKVLPLTAGNSADDEVIRSAYDTHHKTYPFLTKYERAHIIGTRANQLSQGAKPFIVVPEHVTDVKEIARIELQQKRLPYIIKRRLPDGRFEYWRLIDLMILPA